MEWSSSSNNIATVSEDGLVTAVGDGSVTITAKTTDGSNISKSVTLLIGITFEYTLSTDGTYYSVTGIGTWEGSDLVIPSEYEGLPVKEIGKQAFKNNNEITSITIPESIETLGGGAFYHCNSIKKINFNAINCEWNSGYDQWLDFDSDAEIEVIIGENVVSIPAPCARRRCWRRSVPATPCRAS